MNTFILFALLLVSPPDDPIIEPAPPPREAPKAVSSYSMEDFHIYNEQMQLHGLPLVSKLFVIAPSNEDKRTFLKFGEKLPNLIKFATVNIGMDKEVRGLVLSFEDKASTFKALNACLKEGHKVFPIVIYDDIEMIVPDEIVISVHSSVRRSDYLKRLNRVAVGKFDFIGMDNKTFLISAKDLVNPSNILVLTNLIAEDRFWVKWAQPNYIPLNGYVVATTTIETPSFTNLGQERILKLEISVFDPKINLKLDLLPQMGPSFAPFPTAGEAWLDIKPPQIHQTTTTTKKVVSVSYPFRYLQHGSFVFQPIGISYEKNGKLMQVRTETCRFTTKSVIADTNIEDLQPESFLLDVSMSPAIPPTQTKEDYLGVLIGDAKIIAPGILAAIGTVLLLFWLSGLLPLLTGLFENNTDELIWESLDACLDLDFENWRDDYGVVASRLNEVLVSDFGISLYALSPEMCGQNFAKVLVELNKLYMPEEHVEANPEILIHALTIFGRERVV